MSLLTTLLHPVREAKRRALIDEPFPDAWTDYLEQIGHYALLTPDEQARLQTDTRFFVAEKEWEIGGGEPGEMPTEQMKVVIAAQACLLLLGWDEAQRADLFPNVSTVIVYPSGYQTEGKETDGFLETNVVTGRLGEAWSGDLPVILAWQSVLDGAANASDGHNVVLHEFAHKLDMLGGRTANGVPHLPDTEAYEVWAKTMSAEFAELQHDAQRNQKSFLDHYGATNEAKFFAVATEAFFEKSVNMQNEHPALYAAFMGFYQQDTAIRCESASLS